MATQSCSEQFDTASVLSRSDRGKMIGAGNVTTSGIADVLPNFPDPRVSFNNSSTARLPP